MIRGLNISVSWSFEINQWMIRKGSYPDELSLELLNEAGVEQVNIDKVNGQVGE